MTDKVRIGFVGTGGMGQCAHLRNYVLLDTCHVVAMAELREKTAARVGARYRVPAVYNDAAEMLKEEELDAIVASHHFDRHGVLLPQLLEAGLPIFVEKPLSSSTESGAKLLQAVESSGTWIMVGYHKRSDPASMAALEEVNRLRETGELGKLRYIRVLMPAGEWVNNGFDELINEGEQLPPLETEPPPTDMDENAFAEYEAFVNYYIHQINLIRYFLGEPYHATYADPTGVVMGGMSDSGIPVALEMTPYSTTLDWQEHALVCFERGWVRVDLPAPMASNRPGRLTIMRDPGDGATPVIEERQMPWTHAMRRQAMNFVAAVKGERESMCTASEALDDLRVARQYLDLKSKA